MLRMTRQTRSLFATEVLLFCYWSRCSKASPHMIPSLVNLVIGGTSLVRGLPGVASILLHYIPERRGVLKWDRHWIATVLTAQVAAGAALGMRPRPSWSGSSSAT